MEEHEKLISESLKSLKLADHLTYVTYPLVKENKLLIKISEHIYLAMMMAMESLLLYDRYYKRIGPLNDNFESRMGIFKNNVAKRYNLDREYYILLMDLKEILEKHRKSPMVFERMGKVVICSDRYRMKTLSIEDIKHYLGKAKPFILKTYNILTR